MHHTELFCIFALLNNLKIKIMSIKRIFYPTLMILEDLNGHEQTKFILEPGDDLVMTKLKNKTSKIGVYVLNNRGERERQSRYISNYKIQIGNREPFEAGVIANHTSPRAGAYRMVNDTYTPMVIMFDDTPRESKPEIENA